MFGCYFGRRRNGRNAFGKEALVEAIKNTGLPVYSFPERKTSFCRKVAINSSCLNKRDSDIFNFNIDTENKVAIKEISYGEDDRFVNIDISSTKEEVTKENIVFKTTPIKTDSAFYFPASGQSNITADLPDGLFKKINIPEQENIVTLSSASDKETVAEKVFNVIQLMESSGDLAINNHFISEIILASLLVETNQFQENISEKNSKPCFFLDKNGRE